MCTKVGGGREGNIPTGAGVCERKEERPDHRGLESRVIEGRRGDIRGGAPWGTQSLLRAGRAQAEGFRPSGPVKDRGPWLVTWPHWAGVRVSPASSPMKD